LEELQEVTLMSLNIRGFNGDQKQHVIGALIQRNEYQPLCLNETKFMIPVYLDDERTLIIKRIKSNEQALP
jgi:hypothetical protein